MNNKRIIKNQFKDLEESVSLANTPRITVITAVYNAEKYLNSCIKSVLNQNYNNFDYVIIDGGSTDGTIDIIKQNQHQLSYWVSERDQGIYDAWNKGLAVAEGEWIAFVGADDHLHPDALQTYVNHIVKHPRQHELEFVSSQIELVNENLSPIRIVGDAWVWERFRKEMCTWHVGCFHSRSLFRKYGVFDSSYKISGDYELLLRPKNQLIASFIERPTVKMRIGGVSHKHLFKAIDETYRAKIKNQVISSNKGELLRIIDKCRLFIKQMIGKEN